MVTHVNKASMTLLSYFKKSFVYVCMTPSSPMKWLSLSLGLPVGFLHKLERHGAD
jgi:hypothetical protein